MNYEQLETETLTRLQAKLDAAKFDIKIMPDNDASYTAPTQKPCVWIAYAGSTFDQVNKTPTFMSIGPTVQTEVATIELTFQGTKRRGDSQLYNLIELARKALVGWESSQAGKFYLVEARPFDRVQNIWDYKLILGAHAHVVQEEGDEVDGAQITQIGLENEPYNETVIIPSQQ